MPHSTAAIDHQADRDGRFDRDDTFDRSLWQRKKALERANAVRVLRAQLKRDIKAGRARLVDHVAEPAEWLETMRLFDLMLAAPKFGRVKVNKILMIARVSPSKTLGGLSTRQRLEVVALLGGRS